jgi:hypothetical protein
MSEAIAPRSRKTAVSLEDKMYNTCKKHVKSVARSVQHRYLNRIRQLELHIESLNCSLDYYRHYCLKLVQPIPNLVSVKSITESDLPTIEPVNSVIVAELPSLESVNSVIKSELPIIEPVNPVIEDPLPTIEPIKPVTETIIPTIEPAKSVIETESQTIEPAKSVIETELPTIETELPTTEPVKPVKIPTVDVETVKPHLLLDLFIRHSFLKDPETELIRITEVTESIDPRCYNIKTLFKQTSLLTTANILTLIHSKLLNEKEINILLTKNLRKNTNGRIDPQILQSLRNYLISHSKLYHESYYVETSKRFLKAASRRCRLF